MKENSGQVHKILTISLGCDKNLVDTEHMLSLLASQGYSFTDDENEADIAIVNTCSFIHDAKQESVRAILDMAGLKTGGNLKVLLVTGCLAQRYREEIRKEIPEVDVLLGTSSVDSIVQALDKALKGKQTSVFDDINKNCSLGTGRVLTTGGHYAYLKIAEGCDKHCTYCIIPSLRGRFRSVPREELLQEARQLARMGVTELILVAQETTLYGVDLYGRKALPELLSDLCNEVDGLQLIRLLYCYPEEITDELIAVMKKERKIAHYLDMPVQSGSDAILKKMGRRTDGAEIRALVAKLRKEIPDICLRTTFITGFPTETAADFRDTLNLVKELRFDRLGVFTYSREEGTPAARMKGQVSETVKKTRRTRLMKTQQDIAFCKAGEQKGRVLEVIVDGALDEDENGERVFVGRSYMDAPDVDGLVFFTGKAGEYISGSMVRVKITGANGYDLTGYCDT